MKKNKKGFTLVELLAVIVILGVLLLVAVPAISNVIASSKKKAYINSTTSVVDGIKSEAAILNLEDGLTLSSNKCIWSFSDITLEKGQIDGSGYVEITRNSTTGVLSFKVYALSSSGVYSFNGVDVTSTALTESNLDATTLASLTVPTTTCKSVS